MCRATSIRLQISRSKCRDASKHLSRSTPYVARATLSCTRQAVNSTRHVKYATQHVTMRHATLRHLRPFVKCATCDHASNATKRRMRPCVKCVSCDNGIMRQMQPCVHASSATMSFQNSFRYGRVSLGIGDIADEANFFIRANKVLCITAPFYILSNFSRFIKVILGKSI